MGLSTHTHPLQHATETAPMTLPGAVSFSLTPLLVSVPNHLPSRCTCESTPSTELLANIRASSYIASNERWPSPTSEYSPRVTALGSPRTASTSPATTAATAANPPSRRSQHCAAHSIAPLAALRRSQHWASHSHAPVTARDGPRSKAYASQRPSAPRIIGLAV